MEIIDDTAAKRRAYARAWYEKNAARVAQQRAVKLSDAHVVEQKRKYRQDYWLANAERLKQQSAERYRANVEERKQKQAKYRREHPERVKLADDNWRKANAERIKANKAAWQEANAEKMRECMRITGPKWRAENPEKVNAYAAKKRAKRQLRIPNWFGEFDEFVAQEACALAIARSASCLEWHVDHLIPLLGTKASGLHCGLNLQVIPAILNLRKRNKMQLTQPLEWLRHV